MSEDNQVYSSVAFYVRQVYLAPEETVGDDEVDNGKDDADTPPDQSHRLAVQGS